MTSSALLQTADEWREQIRQVSPPDAWDVPAGYIRKESRYEIEGSGCVLVVVLVDEEQSKLKDDTEPIVVGV